jgi:hypothetical protein
VAIADGIWIVIVGVTQLPIVKAEKRVRSL